ncbi:iron complex transport system ATP-binding protein [Baia soyae]|uniref:Iron complex transport system ATP-binding protein n=2 Tax=Baia soyae TaxID=1544746 RepID=A0A4R2S157_9BACL|nr:iron complex transport system ATP-binding protein [Baia soyae]
MVDGMIALETSQLKLAYGERVIIDGLDVEIPKGKITVLIGCNGCGKSTLLRSMARLLKPKTGTILLEGQAISKMATKEIAKQLAILPQGPVAPEGLTVLQLVKQGRFPYQSMLRQWSTEDEELVNKALHATGLDELRDQDVDSLSGGQRQRAWIAMTLAQNPDILLLDEPTTYLDLTHQVEVLDLLFTLNRQENRTILMVLHDLNLACRYADHLIAVKRGAIYAQGSPEDIMTPSLVRDVFQMDCKIISDPIFGTPLLIPHGKGRSVVRKEG